MLRMAFILCAAAGVLAAQQANKTCKLLTKAEVQEAIGAALSDAIPGEGMDTCRFQANGGASVVAVTASRDTSAPSAKRLAVFKESMKNSKPKDLANLGDGAVLVNMFGAGPQVSVFRGADNLLISILGFGDTPKIAAAAEALARKAFSRF